MTNNRRHHDSKIHSSKYSFFSRLFPRSMVEKYPRIGQIQEYIVFSRGCLDGV
nr:MAG TPA: hypothetical protein [Caudoviricetes sp.]DAY91465.1 MAG TPA: hypothetical protein [Caudoviricetes sp.]